MQAPAHASPERPVVLVVEDDEDVRTLVAHSLRRADLEVISVPSIAVADEQVQRYPPAVVVLDRMLPDGDGIGLCARLRDDTRFLDVGVLVLTALGSEHHRVEGLAVGADDYLVKPFSVRELVARVRVLVAVARDRRIARDAGERGEIFRWRELLVDTGMQRVLGAGSEIALRPLEMSVLVSLFRARGVAQSRADLIRTIWGDDTEVRPRLVDMHVYRLRERLGEWRDAVTTVPGFGYTIAPE